MINKLKQLILKNYKTIVFKKKLNKYKDRKIVVGSSNIYQEGWIDTEYYFLDLTKESDWAKYFEPSSIQKILAEHVFEHLTTDQCAIAAEITFKYLEKNGRFRIAVPDGFHTSEEYINYVKPGGTGAGADDHKVLYNYKTLSEIFISKGFKAEPVEYFDENGVFIKNTWSEDDGYIHRSFENDKRNADGKTNYTSLIVDFIK